MNKALLTLTFLALNSTMMNAQTPAFTKYTGSDAALQVTGFANDGSRVLVKDTLFSNPSTIGKIVRKVAVNGQYQWSVVFKGNGIISGITVNQVLTDDNGNVYLLGKVKGTVYYNTDSLKSTFSNAGNVFLAKFSSSGTLVWKWQSVHNEAPFAADDEAFKGVLKGTHIYIGGNSQGRNISFGSVSFPRAQYASMNKVFVAKFDTDGNLKWASMAKNGIMYIRSLNVDASGGVYYGGQSSGTATIDFGNNVSMAVSENSHFVAKYNDNGDAQLAKAVVVGRTSSRCKAASADDAGNMYISGYNDWPSVVNGISLRANVSYLIKLDNTGTYQWTRTFSAANEADGVQNIKWENGKLYFVAKPIPSGAMYVQSGANDSISRANKGVIIGTFTADGALAWNEQGVATNAFAVSSSASIIEASPDKSSLYFGGTYVVDEKFGTLLIPAQGAIGAYQNGYIELKMGSTTGIAAQVASVAVLAYPNPLRHWLNIDIKGLETGTAGTAVSLYDLQGEKVLEGTMNSSSIQLNVGELPKGVYFLRVKSQEFVSTTKLLIE